MIKHINKGELGSEFFFIESGAVMITSGDGKDVIAALAKGDYFGESCLLNMTPRTANAVARGYTSLYVLSNSDFQEVNVNLRYTYLVYNF